MEKLNIHNINVLFLTIQERMLGRVTGTCEKCHLTKYLFGRTCDFFIPPQLQRAKDPLPAACRSLICLFGGWTNTYVYIYTDFSHAQPAHYLGSLLEFQIRKKTHTHEGIQARYRTDISIRGLF